MQRQVRADADHDRQVLALLLGALVGGAQMPAEVELDGGAVRPGQHQPMIGRVVDAGFGIAGDDDAGGDVAAGVGGGVLQRRQHPAEIDVGPVHLLLHGRRARPAPAASDRRAPGRRIRARRGSRCRRPLRHWPGTTGDCRSPACRGRSTLENRTAGPPSSFFIRPATSRLRIGRRRIGLQPALVGHAAERRAKACVENRIGKRQGSLRDMPAHTTSLPPRHAT